MTHVLMSTKINKPSRPPRVKEHYVSLIFDLMYNIYWARNLFRLQTRLAFDIFNLMSNTAWQCDFLIETRLVWCDLLKEAEALLVSNEATQKRERLISVTAIQEHMCGMSCDKLIGIVSQVEL